MSEEATEAAEVEAPAVPDVHASKAANIEMTDKQREAKIKKLRKTIAEADDAISQWQAQKDEAARELGSLLVGPNQVSLAEANKRFQAGVTQDLQTKAAAQEAADKAAKKVIDKAAKDAEKAA